MAREKNEKEEREKIRLVDLFSPFAERKNETPLFFSFFFLSSSSRGGELAFQRLQKRAFPPSFSLSLGSEKKHGCEKLEEKQVLYVFFFWKKFVQDKNQEMSQKNFLFLSLSGSRHHRHSLSEVEPAGPRSVGQRLDAAVVDVAPAVERHGLDVGRLAQLGDLGADELGRALVPAGGPAELLPDFRGEGRGGGERGSRGVVDDLGVDVVVGAEDGEARPLGLALELLFFFFFCSPKRRVR